MAHFKQGVASIERRLIALYFFALSTLIVIDIEILRRSYYRVLTAQESALALIASIVTGAYLLLLYKIIQKLSRRYALRKLMKRAKQLYFHDYTLDQYLETDAIIRLEHWLNCGMCYQLSALAMILAKDFKTAKICRGDCYRKDGTWYTKHSWVEIKIPLNGWCVIDLAWLYYSNQLITRETYFSANHLDGKRLTSRWECGYEEFWGIKFSQLLEQAMRNQKTSRILFELQAYGNPSDGYGFHKKLSKWNVIKTDIMPPMQLSKAKNKPITNAIIKDFVQNPKRKIPKSEHVRRAQVANRRFIRMLKKKKQEFLVN